MKPLTEPQKKALAALAIYCDTYAASYSAAGAHPNTLYALEDRGLVITRTTGISSGVTLARITESGRRVLEEQG